MFVLVPVGIVPRELPRTLDIDYQEPVLQFMDVIS